jgi:hypothetical protein
VADEEFDYHAVIGGMSEWERGWYHGLINSLYWNHSKTEYLDEGEVDRHRIPVDYDKGKWIIARYSPSGSQQHADHFFGPTPPEADDLVTIYFDEGKFRAVWIELDSEASIMYYRLITAKTDYITELEILVASTESERGLPVNWNDWPDNTLDTD